MAEYRIYCLDAVGKISFADVIQAEDDEQAVAIAHEMKPEARKCEVWIGRRLVASLDENQLASRLR